MVILNERAGWHGGRMGAVTHLGAALDDGDEPEHSGHWFNDLGEHGGRLAVGRATPTREYLPDSPDMDEEEASEELVGT